MLRSSDITKAALEQLGHSLCVNALCVGCDKCGEIMRAGLLKIARPSTRRFTFASTSRAAYCPQSILEWHQELASPLPSSEKVLDSLYTAMQSPFPPLQEKQPWIRAQAVEESLHLIFSKGTRAEKERDKLDLIVVGLQRCYKDAVKRVKHRLERDCKDTGTFISEKGIKTLLHHHTDVTAWKRVISSHNLLLKRLRIATESRRKPHQEDVRDSLRLLLHCKQPTVAHYRQFLRLLIKIFPISSTHTEEDSIINRSRSEGHQLRLQMSKDVLRMNNAMEAQALLNRILDSRHDLLPRHFIELFSISWNRMAENFGLDATSFQLAIAMETTLAAWRQRLPDFDGSPFEPVRSLLSHLSKKGFLETRHVNTVLWAALRHRPDKSKEIDWPTMDDCMAVYEGMRANVLWIEMEYEKEGINSCPLPRQSAKENLERGWNAFGLKTGLPVQVIPDQVTYEALIRGLTWQGDLQRATKVLVEMTNSPTDTRGRWKEIEAGRIPSNSNRSDLISPTYEATIATFHSFFKGFCKHGVAPDTYPLSLEDPVQSKCASLHDEDDSNRAWNMQALESLFEAYLNVSPKACRLSQFGYHGDQIEECSASSSLDQDEHHMLNKKFADEKIESLGNSILALDLPADEQLNLSRAPSNNQLFNVLIALRRTSNDDATWVLQQWQRILDKFAIAEGDRKRCIGGRDVNDEGWYDFKINNRLKRTIALLQDKAQLQT